MKILLGVTGGIAAYKALELVRLLVKGGNKVQVVMTKSAQQFIQPLSFQALSGNPVRDSLFDVNQESAMGHIDLSRWADRIVIAPCTADFLAKIRIGRADNLLSTLCLATDVPILLAPAMNRLMWQNAATQENVRVLKSRGLQIMEPNSGEQACGEVGAGRLPEPQQIMEKILNHININILKDTRIIITVGPTHEAIDPVRYIGNRSSGKMGFALAEQAQQMGASVKLIAGPVDITTPNNVQRIDVTSADSMFDIVQSEYKSCDVFIATAAVADFKVASIAQQKIKKTNADNLSLELIKNPDIVAWVAQQLDKPFVVGFAAETENVIKHARKKLIAKQLDLMCANQVGWDKTFNQDNNQLTLLTLEQEITLEKSTKMDQARQLLEFIAHKFVVK